MWEVLVAKPPRIMKLSSMKCTWILKHEFHWSFPVRVTFFLHFSLACVGCGLFPLCNNFCITLKLDDVRSCTRFEFCMSGYRHLRCECVLKMRFFHSLKKINTSAKLWKMLRSWSNLVQITLFKLYETIGHLHDGVILLLRPESFAFLLSCTY